MGHRSLDPRKTVLVVHRIRILISISIDIFIWKHCYRISRLHLYLRPWSILAIFIAYDSFTVPVASMFKGIQARVVDWWKPFVRPYVESIGSFAGNPVSSDHRSFSRTIPSPNYGVRRSGCCEGSSAFGAGYGHVLVGQQQHQAPLNFHGNSTLMSSSSATTTPTNSNRTHPRFMHCFFLFSLFSPTTDPNLDGC